MLVKLTANVKANGQWHEPGESIDLPDDEAHRLIRIGAATANGAEIAVAVPENTELEAMRAELIRLQEFERHQLATAKAAEEAAEAERKAQAEREEVERKAAEKELKALRKKATELGVEGADAKDAETLKAEIAANEQK